MEDQCQITVQGPWRYDPTTSEQDWKIMLSLAREYDLQDIKINFNSEFIEAREKIDTVTDFIWNTAKTIKTWK